MAAEIATMAETASQEGRRELEEKDSFENTELSSSSDMNKAGKSSPSASDQKICGVCGDKALGNNFNAITCESCKAFFRRNALRPKVFVCPFNNDCKVDAVTRRFCQKCRLKKCFDIGMKKEWIMTDEEKKIKKQKIEQNRLKRSGLENSGGNEDNDHSGGEDNDVSSPPAAKVHKRETHHQTASSTQRSGINSTATGITQVIENSMLIGSDEPQRDGELMETIDPSAVHSPKFQKQPMGPHNQNNNAISSYFKKGKGAAIRGNPVSFTVISESSTSPRLSNNEAHDYHQNGQQAIYHFDNHQASSEQPWFDGDESSSSSSASNHNQRLLVPMKYETNTKRQLSEDSRRFKHVNEDTTGLVDEMGEKVTHHETNNAADSSNQMPLLSSLISPGYPESSPDPVSSPPPVFNRDYDDDHSSESKFGNSSFQLEQEVIKQQQRKPQQHHHNQILQLQRQNLINAAYQNQEDFHSRHHTETSPRYDDYSLSPPEQMTKRKISQKQQQVDNSGNVDYHRYDSSSPPMHGYTDHHYGDERQYNNCNGGNGHSNHQEVTALPVNTIDSILSIAIAAEFNAFGVLGTNLHSRELNKAEHAKLNELLLAGQALHAPVDAERPIKVSESSDPSLLNVINLTEIAIRRLIKMSKKISGFKNMCQEDQIALLKGGSTEMMILRSAATYDPDRDSWQIPHSNPGGQYNINLGVLKEARGNLYEEHQRFIKSFRAQWRKDENIMVILSAITLFTPERSNVVHKDVVKLEQDSYYYLLKRYLESIFNGCEAKSTYLQLIRKVAELRALNSSHVRVFLEMNPKEVEPLLIEIFDMK